MGLFAFMLSIDAWGLLNMVACFSSPDAAANMTLCCVVEINMTHLTNGNGM
jgi:hypothetical protein